MGGSDYYHKKVKTDPIKMELRRIKAMKYYYEKTAREVVQRRGSYKTALKDGKDVTNKVTIFLGNFSVKFD